ncbi:hypothetical protein D3C71_144300 [compost metagenome]
MKLNKYTDWILPAAMALLFAGLYSCANIVPPSGGEKDITPPKLLSMSPEDSMRNQKVRKIVLHFDKFVELTDLQKNLDLSPQLDIQPSVVAIGKRVEIKIVDSLLKPNTTYRISLGNAITDNREKTPYGNFRYTFTTGDYFDSLQLQGNVADVYGGHPDTGAIVVLYPEPFSDSMLLTKKAMYVTRVDQNGHFKFSGLPDKSFHIFAIADADDNKMYGLEERIGFINGSLNPKPESDSTSITLYSSKAKAALVVVKDTTVVTKPFTVGKIISTDKNAQVYIVQADSAHLERETFELNKPLGILLNTIVGKIDSSKIYLSYSNTGGIETEARRTISTDSSRILIHHRWEPETVYTLRLVKGWAMDTAGKELPPAKLSFRTKRNEDYAMMNIHIPVAYRADSFVLSVYKDQDSIYQRPVTDSMVTLTLLDPGKYTIRIIADSNKNGIWDPGDFWKKLQPEMIFPHQTTVDLKPGWENDIDFVFDPAVLIAPQQQSALKKKEAFERR